MNKIFKKSRSVSPSFEIPKICLPRQECVDDGYDEGLTQLSTSTPAPTTTKSLKVPTESRVRSSSFDSSSLHKESKEFLTVPKKNQGRRCHSFDSACSLQMSDVSSEENVSDKESSAHWTLKLPKSQKRRSSYDIPKLCIHCIHMESKAQEWREREEAMLVYQPGTIDDDSDQLSFNSSTSYTSSFDSPSDHAGFYYLSDSEDEGNESDCEDNVDSPAFPIDTLYPSNNNASTENQRIEDFLNGRNLPHIDSKDEDDEDDENNVDDEEDDDDDDDDEDYINAVTLAVPNVKQIRSSSMDSYHLKVPEKQMQRQKSFDNGDMLDVPIQVRSSSVDVNLPTDEDSSYKAIPHSDSRWVDKDTDKGVLQLTASLLFNLACDHPLENCRGTNKRGIQNANLVTSNFCCDDSLK